MIDWVNVFTILHYARLTQKRRKQRGLPPLRDPNDLPEALDAEVSSSLLDRRGRSPEADFLLISIG